MSQTASNIQVSVKRQSAKGSPESGSGADGYNVIPTQGLVLNKAAIASELVRRDGMTTRGRHGSRSSSAVYGSELSVGTFTDWIEAALRGTAVAATDITEADMTSITTTTSTIVAAAGSWLTEGVRKGDMVKLTGHSTAGNNGKWLRVLNVTASVITVPAASLTLNASADTAFTLTVAKTIINGATPVERYHTVEEYEQDLDTSLLGTDMKIVKLDFDAQPNKNIKVTFTFLGLDANPQDTGTAPVLTSPTYSATLPLVMVDGSIRIGGVDYDVLTGFQFSWDLGGSVPPTLSSVSDDVYLGNGKISGSFTAHKKDLVFLQAFDAETPVDFFIVCAENESDPADFESFYIGNATLNGNASAIASEGPRVQTIPWAGGIDEAGGASASTMIKYSTSAT